MIDLFNRRVEFRSSFASSDWMESPAPFLSQSDVKRSQPIVICLPAFSRSHKRLHGFILLCIMSGSFCCLGLLWLVSAVTKTVADKNVFGTCVHNRNEQFATFHNLSLTWNPVLWHSLTSHSCLVYLQIGVVYICSRLYVNVSQSYLPLYLTETMRFEKVREELTED